MNLGRAFDSTPRLLTDQTKIFGSSGETHRVFGKIAQTDQPFRVTLAWTDAPGATVSAPWINNLDLEVTVNGQTYLGNVFSGANSIPGGIADGKNNVESVFLPAGVSGNFTVTIRATNIAGDGLPGNDDLTDQDFALVVYNANSVVPDSPVIDLTPSRLNFTAIAGGSNPADQTINLSNIGIDTLNWTASADASWVIVSQMSGAAPSTLDVSAKVNDLPEGFYKATVTIVPTNAPNSPIRVPVELIVYPPFETSPLNLDFAAKFGAGNPPCQTLNIVNVGSAAQRWTASVDAPWLMISPTSGTAPSTLTVSANVSGLEVGTYYATIIITPTAVPESIVIVPATLIVDRLANGGFEGTAAPWILSGVAQRSTAIYPHTGFGYLLMEAANSSSGSAYQQLTLPRSVSPNLSFWLNVSSDETTTTAQNDKLFVEVCNTSGRVLKTLATFSNLNKTVSGLFTQQGNYSLAGFAGQTMRVQFRTTTNSSLLTTFRIDDVSVK